MTAHPAENVRYAWPYAKLPFEHRRWMGEMVNANVATLIFNLRMLVEAVESLADEDEVYAWTEDVEQSKRIIDAYYKAIQKQFAGTRVDSRYSGGHQDGCTVFDDHWCTCEPFVVHPLDGSQTDG